MVDSIINWLLVRLTKIQSKRKKKAIAERDPFIYR